MSKKLTQKQLLVQNISFYMSGQSSIPHQKMFKEGYFDFINGEVIATAKALKLYKKMNKPWDKRLKISKLEIDWNAKDHSCLRVVVDYASNQSFSVVFGGGKCYNYYNRDDEGSVEYKLFNVILANYELFANKVLKFAQDKGFHNNLKKSKAVQAYISNYPDNRFTWMKWLLNELGVREYKLRDKNLFKAEPADSKWFLETYTSRLENKDFAMMLTSPILLKHFDSKESFFSLKRESGEKYPTLETYIMPNPGASEIYPKHRYGEKITDDDDYDDDDDTSTPLTELIQYNLVSVVNGEVKFNPDTETYIQIWENKYKEQICNRVGDWRLTSYGYNYSNSDEDDDEERQKDTYNIKWELPDTSFSMISIATDTGDGDELARFHMIELSRKLGVADQLYQGLATVTHPRMMMDIMTQTLKHNTKLKDNLTAVKSSIRGTIAGVLDHIEKHMV